MKNQGLKFTRCLFAVLVMNLFPIAALADFQDESILFNNEVEEATDSLDEYGHRLLPDSVYLHESFSNFSSSDKKIPDGDNGFDNPVGLYNYSNCYPYNQSIILNANNSPKSFFTFQNKLDSSYSRVFTISCRAWMKKNTTPNTLYFYHDLKSFSSVVLRNTAGLSEYSFDIVQDQEYFRYGFGVTSGKLFFDDFKITYRRWIEKTLTDGYCTIADYPHSLVVPENTEAYTLIVKNSVLYKGYIYRTGDAIPPHEAVVLHNTVDEKIRLREVADEGKADPNNLLHGSSKERDAYIIYPNKGTNYPGSFYVLGRDANKKNIGFYWYYDSNKGNGTFTMPCHRAFLYIPPTNSASKISSFKLDETSTFIDEVRSSENSESRRFNLYGQPVGDNYKGIVIEKGKKILVK